MTEKRGHRLACILAVFVSAVMMTGLMVLVPDEAKAYPDNALITGNVSDGTDPVENAYVKTMLFMGNGLEINWTLTDVNGDYAMMVPGGLQYMIFAAHGDYYMSMDQLTISPGQTVTKDFTLIPIMEAADVTISGYVTDEFGTPRSDGHVLAMVTSPLGGDMPYYANLTTPDLSGYFEVNVIPGPNGGGAIGMDFPGYPMAQNDTNDPLLPGMSYTFNIELKPMTYSDDAMVYGVVTDIDTGLPLPSAVISYESEDGMDRHSNWTMTNDTGYYEMGVQTGNWFRLSIQKIGYTVKFFEIDINPSEVVGVNAALRMTTAVIKGNVTDFATGLPMQFVRVFLVDNPNMSENMSFAQTGSDGYYELGAFEGNDLFLGVEQDGYARNYTMINVTSGDELWWNFALKPYSSWLVGQVTDARTGAPIGNANVHVRGPIEDSQWTDGMGMYNLSMVPGDYDVDVNYWMGWPGYKSYNSNFTIGDGEELVLNVALMPWDSAQLMGHIYDVMTGDPVPFANIWLSGGWGNWTSSNDSGYYEMFATDGDFTVYVDAPGYNSNSVAIHLSELEVLVLDISLMPQTPPDSALLHGYVTNSDDSSPVSGADVRIRIDGGPYENWTSTDMTGYYEMHVPPWVLNVKVTAWQHAPSFGQINMTGLTDYSMDIALGRDTFEPNMTFFQMPSGNISWSNPSMIQVTIQEENLREMTLIRFMEWNSSGLDSNWTMIDWKRTSFDPWNPENNLPYWMDDGNYSVNDFWDSNVMAGWLSDGMDSVYLPASTWPWFMEPVYAVSGYYANSTSMREQGSVLFNMTTGQFMAFVPRYTGSPSVWAPDPTGVFEPEALVIQYDNGMIVDFNWRALEPWSVNGLTFTFDSLVPTGNYKTEFYAQDWGNMGNYTLVDNTVDQDSPTADAGPDQNVGTNSIVTLDGRASADNVGVVMYMWEFYNATGVWTTLWGDVVTCSFELVGSYDINLTVWDSANHQSNDSLTVTVFLDSKPIADAGVDQTVDEDTVVFFDGSLSWDDVGITGYTWYIVEYTDWMYGEYPTYTFWDPGVYHVQLVVTDTAMQNSDPDEVIITVEDATPPVADAGWDQYVVVGTTVTLDGSWSWDNVGIVDYEWSFFDVMPVELHGMTVDYTFSNPGLYQVILTVYDDADNSGSDDMWVTVDSPPTADAGLDQTVDEDTEVFFDGSMSWDDVGISFYTWYIVETGDWMYNEFPTYTFWNPGVYHVQLVVTDTAMQDSIPDEMIVTVRDATPPVADAGGDRFVSPGTTVTLDGSWSWDNVGIVDYEWSFFDVVPVELHGVTADYTFWNPGSYYVILTVYDAEGNSGWDDMWVTVDSPPIADAGPDQIVDEDTVVSFDGSLSWDDVGIIDWTWYIWELGDWMYGEYPTYTFWTPGVYHVELVVTDTVFQSSLSDEVVITVNDVTDPVADAGVDQEVGEWDYVHFDGSSSWDNVGIVDYVWSFFDVVPIELHGMYVDYMFSAPGTYLVTLTVYDGAGNWATDDMWATVDSRPVADAGPDQIVAEDTMVTFDGSGSYDDGTITDYVWEIVELSDFMSGASPTYTFDDPGVYHVTLYVIDDELQLSDLDEMIVTVNDVTPPVADAGLDILVGEGGMVTFDGTLSYDNNGIVDYVWSFFDVMPVELHGATADYTFSAPGVYVVTLTVYDAAGLWDQDDVTVTVDAIPVAIAGPDQTVSEDTVVTFDGSGSYDDYGIAEYFWTIAEIPDSMYGVGPTYTFSEPGVYHVTLVVSDAMSQYSAPDEVVITVLDVTNPIPEAGPDQMVNYGTLVTLDASASWDNVGIVDYVWSFTDGIYTELNGAIVSYTFNTPSSYWVDLYVEDAAGNWAMDGLWVYVNGPPVAWANDQWISPGGEAYLSGWSCSDDFDWYYDLEYNWTFTYDGSVVTLIGNDPDVYYRFDIMGTYTVYLTVTDTGGLSDSTTMQVYVASYMSSWWVDPRTDETVVDGAVISLDYATMRGYVDSWEEVTIVTSSGTYLTNADGDGLFEMTDIMLSDGLNVATVSSYSDWWGDTLSWFKLIQSDTYCRLWVDSVTSPTNAMTIAVSGWTDANADVVVNGIDATVARDGSFSADIGLSEGSNVINVTASDAVGNMNWNEFIVVLDTTPPALVISGPADNSNVSEPNVVVYGTVDAGASVRVNGVLASAGTDWAVTVSLVEGANTITVTAADALDNTATQTLTVNYVPPVYVTPEELEEVRTELMGEINNLTASLQENVTTLQGEIDAAMDDIAALQASLAENITLLQGEIDSAMDEITALQASLAENITLLQNQIDAALADIADLQASVAENVTDLQGQIDAAMADIVGLQGSLLENVTDLQAQITDAMADIVSLETALAENVTALQGDIADAVADISALQSALAENVTSLTAEIATLETQLQENVTALQLAIAQNATALQQAIAQNITSLQSQIAGLRSDLQANVTALNAALATNVSSLSGMIAILDDDVAEILDELNAVNSTLTAAQDDMAQAIDQMQADLGDLQQEISDLNQTTEDDIDDVTDKADDTDSFARMLMYLTLILFAISVVLIGLVWFMGNKRFGKGGAGTSPEAIEEVEEPSEVEKEFESLEKELKREEL